MKNPIDEYLPFNRANMLKKTNFVQPLHLYRCSECDYKLFATWFAPMFEETPAYCPCCADDKTVEYIGEVGKVELYRD